MNASLSQSSPRQASQTTLISTEAIAASFSGRKFSSSTCSGHSGAPIISGTAAAILARTKPHDDVAPNSTASEGCCKSSGTNSSGSASGESKGCFGRSLELAQFVKEEEPRWIKYEEEQYINRAKLVAETPSSLVLAMTPVKRYSDGAPIIEGTAAARIAIAAAARAAQPAKLNLPSAAIVGGSRNGISPWKYDSEHESSCRFGPLNFFRKTSPATKLSSPMIVSRESTTDEKTTKSISTQFSGTTNNRSPAKEGSKLNGDIVSSAFTQCQNNMPKALSWIDHAAAVTPDDPEAVPKAPIFQASAQPAATTQKQLKPVHNSSHAQNGGGMDILADIICHAPPMIVPTALKSSNTTPLKSPPQSFPTRDIPTVSLEQSPLQDHLLVKQRNDQYQRPSSITHSYSHIKQERQQTPLNSYLPERTQLTYTLPNQRVSAIPSYQEIYQEMREMERRSQDAAIPKPFMPMSADPSYSSHSLPQCTSQPQAQLSPAPIKEETSTIMYPIIRKPQHLPEPPTKTTPKVFAVEEARRPCIVETIEPPPPRPSQRSPSTHFGHATNGGVIEGKALYSRKDLAQAGAHTLENKDVHGNMREGADSIVICKLERDIREGDGLCWLLYSCDRANGGGALCKNYHKRRAIRVFRSSTLGGRFAPPYLDDEEDDDIGYRYDGLYMVRAVWDVNGKETESFPCNGDEGWQTYFFTRLPKKPLDGKVEPGMQYNQLGLQELWGTIQKTRGVRRPKKFEIPRAPMKLPPLKKTAITGENKDRKSTSYRPPKPKVLTNQKITPCVSNNVANEVPEKEESSHASQHEESGDDSESSNEVLSKTNADVDTDSETSCRPQRASATLARTFLTKVLSQRLGDVHEHKHLKPTTQSSSQRKRVGRRPSSTDGDDESEQSSDSEVTSVAGSECDKDPNAKRRKTIHHPDEAVNLSPCDVKSPAASVETPVFFPKRSSAAKAEAANRNLLGAVKKRNSQRKLSPGREGKRTKLEVNESSSETEHVDHEVLTVGSRVLVVYKGSLFKATIRRRREKAKRHEFLIHYDGNKKSNVHWVPIDRIPEIISIAVDTSSRKKTQSKRKDAHRKEADKDSDQSVSSAQDDDDNDIDDKTLSELKAEANEKKNTEVDIDEMPLSELKPQVKNKYILLSQLKHTSIDSKSAIPAKVRGNENEIDTESRHDANPLTTISQLGTTKNAANTLDTLANGSLREKEDETRYGPDSPSHLLPHKQNDTVDNLRLDNCDGAEKKHEPKKISKILNSGLNSMEEEPTQHLKHADDPPDNIQRSNHPESIQTEQQINSAKTCTSSIIPQIGENQHDAERKSISKSAQTVEKQDSEECVIALPANNITDNNKPCQNDKDVDENSANINNVQVGDKHNATSEIKFPLGSQVYVEYRDILYSSNILKTRRRRGCIEYLVHYEGYKKASNRWVKEASLHIVNEASSKRFDEQRLVPAEMLFEPEQSGSSEFNMVTRGKKASESQNAQHHVHSTRQKSRRSRLCDALDQSESLLGDIEPGVAFLPGSCVFVEWSGALYLAKMLKKRFSGSRTEYLISYDGFKSNHDAWVSISKIYEVNPQTKRIFNRIASETIRSGDRPRRDAPGPRRKETRKRNSEDNASNFEAPKTKGNDQDSSSPRIDMQGIQPGVQFLPGSTLFAEWKDGLYLAKMLKKRGKGDYMEYFIQYNGFKTNETAWVSTALVYEINPQTKRIFRQFSKRNKT